MRSSILYPLCAALSITAVGCVDRLLTIDSDPPGSVVYMNDQELGRTPLRKDFTVYGNYDVQVRKDGYQTLKTNTQIQEPWWQLIPLDLVTEVLPLRFRDERHLQYTLSPTTQESVDAHVMVDRATELKSQLLSSPNTRIPTSFPTSNPAK